MSGWPSAAQLAIELVDPDLAKADLALLKKDSPKPPDERLRRLYNGVLNRAGTEVLSDTFVDHRMGAGRHRR